jgi:serine/threonine protein kinase
MAHDRLGKWRLIKELGAGGQGSVYLAFDEEAVQISAWDAEPLHKLGEQARHFSHARENGPAAEAEIIRLASRAGVGDAIATLLDLAGQVKLGALKKLRPSGQWTRDPEHVKDRLVQEIEILAEVRHPALIRVLDHDKTAPWLVTEYHQRGSLKANRHLFSGQPLLALTAIRGLASGIAAVHAKKIIHRDIKPENVFVGTDGRLILGDFGLALPSDTERHTRTGDNAGTYAWMPPWAMNIKSDFMPTFDIYALGKLLWYLLSDKDALPTEYADADIRHSVSDGRAADAIEQVIRQSVVLRKEDCLPTVDSLLAEVDNASEAASAPANALHLKVAAHAVARPGPLYLVSAEAAKERQAPVGESRGTWKIWHPRAFGRGQQFPGPSGEPQPAIPNNDLWREFVKLDKDHRRWLVSPPEPTSFDNHMDFEFGPIPMCDARFLQVAIKVDRRSQFTFYLRFSDNRWIDYSNELESGKIEGLPEYKIRDPALAPSDSIHFVTRDIRKDLEQTWHSDGVKPDAVEAVRLRGGFGLLLVRII